MTRPRSQIVAFSLAVGLAMPPYWPAMIADHRIDETEEGRRVIWFHVAAEIVTGLVLIAGAFAAWSQPNESLAALVSAIGLGMLLNTMIVSPGCSCERHEWPMVVMFGGVRLPAAPAFILRLTI